MKKNKLSQIINISVIAFALSLFLSACSTTGIIKGFWKKSKNSKSANVALKYYQNPSATSGNMAVILPSGEIFKGRFVQITSTSTSDSVGVGWGAWDPYWGDWGPYDDPWYSGGSMTTFRKNYSGKVIATLFDQKNNSMRCRIRLASPSEGLGGGGLGECQTSKGGVLKLQF